MTPAAGDRRFLAGIQNRLIIAFLTVAVIPVVVLAIYGAQNHLRALEELAFNAAANEAHLRARKLQDALADAQSDLFYLSQMAGEVSGNGGWEQLGKQFEAFVASRGTYRSAVHIDDHGRELVRVNRVGTATTIVPFEKLRSKPPHEDLLYHGEHLLAVETLTRIDTREPEAVVYFVTRLFPSRLERRGFVMLEIPLPTLWNEEELGASAARVAVFDQDGRPLIGNADDLPREVLQTASGQPNRPIETEQGQIITLVPLHPDRANPGEQWSFVTIKPRSVVFASLIRYRRVFTVVLLGTLAGAGGISVLLARQFTVPLRRLYAAAQAIGHGRFDVSLDDSAGDEIGGLARELRAMADKLKIRHDDMQQQIDEKTRELLQAERLSTIGTMSAAIAHEVNNPLGIIALYSQMLLEQLGPDDPRVGKIKVIAREASRMSVLVRGLLQFASRPTLNLARVDLSALIGEAVAASRDLQEDVEGVEVRMEVAADCPVIDADADQLGQVLRNLIVNAFHALGAGGSVTISAAPADFDGAAIRVSDTGHGIDAESLPRLFEPFFTTRRFGAGTGLGLSISREIVERHGGTISVVSEPGKGTTFTIVLPRHARSVDRRDDQESAGATQT